MEKLMDLYRSVQSPLDDIEKLKKIIRTYSDSRKNNRDFYNAVLKCNSKDKQYIGYNSYKEEVLDYWRFSTWVSNIVEMTPERYAKFYGKEEGYYSNEFTMLQSYLKPINESVSMENFRKIQKELKSNYGLENAYEKYNYEIFQSGWDYISSTDLFESEPIEVKHRLYINCDSVRKYDVIGKIIDNFNKNNIPIFFKYNDAHRDDTIVLWTDDENLLRTINMLKKIKEKVPEDTCLKPAILAGNIDGWLGYGSEPTVLLNGKTTSFNRVRAKVIEDAIKNVYERYILFHPNAKGLSESEVAERDLDFIQDVRNEIIEVGKEYGVDEKNFCFDTKTVEQMKKADSKEKIPVQEQSKDNVAEENEDEELNAILEEVKKYSIKWEDLSDKRDVEQVVSQEKSIETSETSELEPLLKRLKDIEENDKKKKANNQAVWKRKFDKRDKNYYKNAEAYLLGKLKRLTPEQRKRGNQYLSALEQEKNIEKGND